MDRINTGGKLFVGDVAFENIKQLEECRNINGNEWDFDELYPVVEVFSSKF